MRDQHILTYWDSNPNPGRTEAFTHAGQSFAEKAGLEFRYVPKSIQSYPADVMEAWAHGEGPDLVDVWPLWIPLLKERLLDLTPFVESWESAGRYDPTHARLSRSVDERYWFLACDLFIQGTHYRRDLVEAAGLEDPRALDEQGEWTLDRFVEYARALHAPDAGINGVSLRGGQGGELVVLNLMVSANEGRLFDESGTCLLDTPGAVSALEQYASLVHPASVAQSTASTDGYREFAWRFYEGRAAMMLHNDDGAKSAQKRYLGRDLYGNCRLPSPEGRQPWLGLAGFGVGVHAASPMAREAARYALYFVGNYNNNLSAGEALVSGNRMAFAPCGPMHPWPEERDPVVEPFRRILESPDRFYTLPYHWPAYGEIVQSVLQPGIADLFSGRRSAAETARTWANALTGLARDG